MRTKLSKLDALAFMKSLVQKGINFVFLAQIDKSCSVPPHLKEGNNYKFPCTPADTSTAIEFDRSLIKFSAKFGATQNWTTCIIPVSSLRSIRTDTDFIEITNLGLKLVETQPIDK